MNETLRKVCGWIYDNRVNLLISAFAIIALWLLFDTTEAMLATVVIAGTDGGKHVVDGPLTTDVTKANVDGLLLNEIDRQIVKIRPMATPIDQLSRCAGSKHSGSMVVDYYNVDTKPTTVKMANAYNEPIADFVSSSDVRVRLRTTNNEIFDVSDTILVQGISGYDEKGVNMTANELVLYVISKNESGEITVIAVNGKSIGGIEGCCPSIPKDTPLIRMGRAATELDVQTPQFEALPQKAQNFCQIFKMQIEQSTLQKIANKEVDWTMSDQEEAAIYDMRLGMEKNFLFGVKRRIYDNTKKENVMLTGGIWHQAGKEFEYEPTDFTEETLVDVMREAFTGNAGSKRKVLIGGSGLIGRLNKLVYTKVVNAGENVVKWGIDFSELRSKFGRLYVLLSEVFDECGMADAGIIVDPEYLQKYSHLPFSTEALNLKASGQRNTDALVLTEASCLVLRYPKAHMRIVAKA